MPVLLGFRGRKDYRPYSALLSNMPMEKRSRMGLVKHVVLSAVRGARVVMPDVAPVPWGIRELILNKRLADVAQRRARLLKANGSIYLKSMAGAMGNMNARVDLSNGFLTLRTTDGNLLRHVAQTFGNFRMISSDSLELPIGKSMHALEEALGKIEFVAFRKADIAHAEDVRGLKFKEEELGRFGMYSGGQRRIIVPKIMGKEWEIRMVNQLVEGEREITASFVKFGTGKGVNSHEISLACNDVGHIARLAYMEIFPRASENELDRLSGDFVRRLRHSTREAADSIEELVVKRCESHGEPNVRLDGLSMDFLAEFDPAKRRLVPILNDVGLGKFGTLGLKDVDPDAARMVMSLKAMERLKKI